MSEILPNTTSLLQIFRYRKPLVDVTPHQTYGIYEHIPSITSLDKL